MRVMIDPRTVAVTVVPPRFVAGVVKWAAALLLAGLEYAAGTVRPFARPASPRRRPSPALPTRADVCSEEEVAAFLAAVAADTTLDWPADEGFAVAAGVAPPTDCRGRPHVGGEVAGWPAGVSRWADLSGADVAEAVRAVPSHFDVDIDPTEHRPVSDDSEGGDLDAVLATFPPLGTDERFTRPAAAPGSARSSGKFAGGRRMTWHRDTTTGEDFATSPKGEAWRIVRHVGDDGTPAFWLYCQGTYVRAYSRRSDAKRAAK